MGSNLFIVCGMAFLAVILLLGFLAVAMSIITLLFPPKSEKTDKALVAAIGSVVAANFSGAQLVNIKEEKR